MAIDIRKEMLRIALRGCQPESGGYQHSCEHAGPNRVKRPV
jgi:hypothetical protein